MASLGGTHLFVLVALVVLVFDSRRLHGLARSLRGSHTEGGIPPGVQDRVGLTLRQIQMRKHVDWEDGGIGWEGPEVLPADDDVDGDEDAEEAASAGTAAAPALPVLWQPFRALPAGTDTRLSEADGVAA